MAELPGARWRRCAAHIRRSLWVEGPNAFVVLAHVPQSEQKVVAEDLKEVFSMKRRSTAESLAQAFIGRYRDRFKRAVELFAQGLDEALIHLGFPGYPRTRMWRSGFWGSAQRASVPDWSFRRHAGMEPLRDPESEPTKIAT